MELSVFITLAALIVYFINNESKKSAAKRTFTVQELRESMERGRAVINAEKEGRA